MFDFKSVLLVVSLVSTSNLFAQKIEKQIVLKKFSEVLQTWEETRSTVNSSTDEGKITIGKFINEYKDRSNDGYTDGYPVGYKNSNNYDENVDYVDYGYIPRSFPYDGEIIGYYEEDISGYVEYEGYTDNYLFNEGHDKGYIDYSTNSTTPKERPAIKEKFDNLVASKEMPVLVKQYNQLLTLYISNLESQKVKKLGENYFLGFNSRAILTFNTYDPMFGEDYDKVSISFESNDGIEVELEKNLYDDLGNISPAQLFALYLEKVKAKLRDLVEEEKTIKETGLDDYVDNSLRELDKIIPAGPNRELNIMDLDAAVLEDHQV